jgi:hypothetical protein
MVGVTGFEPATPTSRILNSSHCSPSKIKGKLYKKPYKTSIVST